MSRSFCPIWTAVVLGLAAMPSSARAEPASADSAAVPFPAPTVRSWQVGLLRPDRLQHASLSLTVGLAAGLLTRSAAVAGWGSFALGVAKEIYDVRGSGFDAVDLCADAMGAGAAAIATNAVAP